MDEFEKTIELAIPRTFARPRANSTLHNFASLYAFMLAYCFAGGDRICSLKSDGGSVLNLKMHHLFLNLVCQKVNAMNLL